MAGELGGNWQEGKTLAECNLYLMEHKFSDVTFRLNYKDENKREQVADIPALRILCLARSPVFFAMFAGELAQQLDNPIHEIHDDLADPEAFKELLRYMYSDDVTLTADNVLAILYLSQKYIVTSLAKRCLRFLEEHLTPDTAPILLEQSMLYEEKELKEKTLTTIQDEAAAVLASDEFLDISKEALGEVLKLNLKVEKEVTVFEACMKWAKKQCQKRKKTASGENMREVLGDALYQIRFPIMSVSEFSDIVVPQKVLTTEEGFEVFRYLTSESNKPDTLPFPTEQRVAPDPTPRLLIVPAPYSTIPDGLHYQDVHNKITTLSCTVSKALHIRKILVCASNKRDRVKAELAVTLKQNGKCLHTYTGQPSRITGQLPNHYTVDVDDVRVEPGVMEVCIGLNLSKINPNQGILRPTWYDISYSSPETSQLADDYVTITFPPVDPNLLLGIEYRM